MHCVAGDATGIVVAAIVTALLGLPIWADLIVEHAGGFLVASEHERLGVFPDISWRDLPTAGAPS